MNMQDIVCPSCGYSELAPVQPVQPVQPVKPASANHAAPVQAGQTKNTARVVRIIAFAIMAVSILISFEIAGNLIAKGGDGISSITSVGGRTLEEAYYYELGFIYEGYALIVKSVGRVFAALLLWAGVKK